MRPHVGDRVLNAEYSVEREGDRLALVLESAGGRASPSARYRNADYNQALAVLITRLRERDGVILDALVDSRRTRHLPEEARLLLAGPVRLSDYPDSEVLRRRLTSPQARIGESGQASRGRNSSKRIRLRISVPGYGLDEADRLARDLAGPSSADITLAAMLTAVEQLDTQPSVGGPKRHQPLTLLWAIGRAHNGQDRLVPWPEAKAKITPLIRRFGRQGDASNAYLPFLALANTELWELSSVPPVKSRGGDARRDWLNSTMPPVEGGLTQPVHELLTNSAAAVAQITDILLLLYFDSADESALLSAVGVADVAAEIETHRRRFLLQQVSNEPPGPAAVAFKGILTRTALTEQRGEQTVLRRLLLQKGAAACALCGAELPERFLVAAHIKKRSLCTEQERRDVDNIAMLACTLGCDSLYEHGYVSVSKDGGILLSEVLDDCPALLDHARRRLSGRTTTTWSSEREPYFAWHRAEVFRRRWQV